MQPNAASGIEVFAFSLGANYSDQALQLSCMRNLLRGIIALMWIVSGLIHPVSEIPR